MADEGAGETGSRSTVLVERDELTAGGVLGTMRLHRPDVLNAFTPAMLERCREALAELVADEEVTLIRLTGAGRAFSAGVDLKALGSVPVAGGAVGSSLDDAARALIAELETAPKVVIGQVNGFCFTGALEIALACDILVIAREARLGDTHAKFGLRPTWGMSQRLPLFVGPARARELSYTARTFTGEQALAWGLAAHAPPLEDLDMTVLDLAQQIAQNSAGSLAAYKRLYREALDRGLSAGLAFEAATSFDIADSEERLADFRR